MDFFFLPELSIVPENNTPSLLYPVKREDCKLAVWVPESENPVLLEGLLRKILEAAGFEPGKEVAVLLIDPEMHFRFQSVASMFQVAHILSFGLHDRAIHTQFHKVKYQWLSFLGCKILFSDELSVLQQKETVKKQLWLALKNEFIP